MVSLIALGLIVVLSQAPADKPEVDEPEALSEARSLWRTGKYAEALESLETLAKKADLAEPVRARVAIATADCLTSQGEYVKAAELLQATAAKIDAPDVWGRLANVEFERGDWEKAEAAANKAVAKDKDHLQARWVLARLMLAKGEIEAGIKACQWFVDHFNAHQATINKDADALLIVGQASELYFCAEARGDDLSEQLNNVINNIYEQAIKTNKLCWQAAWLEGRLFLSGYNERAGIPELQRALKINPRAAEALVTLGQSDLQGYKLAAGRQKGERALAVNPNFLPAHVLIADLNISDERFDDAFASARKAVAGEPQE